MLRVLFLGPLVVERGQKLPGDDELDGFEFLETEEIVVASHDVLGGTGQCRLDKHVIVRVTTNFYPAFGGDQLAAQGNEIQQGLNLRVGQIVLVADSGQRQLGNQLIADRRRIQDRKS